MKTLLLVRHAKSSWEHSELNDEERPLLKQGIKKTQLVCDYLSKHAIRAERIISSHAVRAFETARIIASSIGYSEDEIYIDKRLYENGVYGYSEVLNALPDNIESVMLFGHNPSITVFANSLIHEKIDYIPTTGIVSIQIDTNNWKELAMAKSTLKFYTYPKQLK